MASAVSIRHFVLGLLTQEPMSGYDVKRLFKSLNWLIDSPSFGSLYPALHSLLEDGLVTVEVVPSQGKPPRKIYSITPAGREVLAEWMDQPIDSGFSLKTFVMRLALAGSLSHTCLVEHLQQRRDQVAEHQRTLEQNAEEVDENADLGERLTLDYGLALAMAELNWLDRALTRLSRPPLSVEAAEATQGDIATLTV